MARKRWATFSVADHLDVLGLVPDILLFDRLAFPFPADEKEWTYWDEQGWEPSLLRSILTQLGDLALPVEWGDEQRARFATNMQQAEVVDKLALSPIKFAQPFDLEIHWENEKYMTRYMIGNYVQEERGTDFWVMPRYPSYDAFLRDQGAKIAPADHKTRREKLALLVGQKMMVPHHADPGRALRLAVELAQDDGYLRRRRDLFNWQETVIQRDQSPRDDLEELQDLIADLNEMIARQRSQRREQWVFYALKRAADVLTGDFLGFAADAAIEAAEIMRDRPDTPGGAMAAFHHVRARVLEPSIPK
jgi:hypothetical protein